MNPINCVDLGLGALLSPMVATRFAQMHRWSFHFFIAAGMAVFNAVILLRVTKLQNIDSKPLQVNRRFLNSLPPDLLLHAGIQPQRTDNTETGDKNIYRRILCLPAVHLLTALLFIYVGIAVTLGGAYTECAPNKH